LNLRPFPAQSAIGRAKIPNQLFFFPFLPPSPPYSGSPVLKLPDLRALDPFASFSINSLDELRDINDYLAFWDTIYISASHYPRND